MFARRTRPSSPPSSTRRGRSRSTPTPCCRDREASLPTVDHGQGRGPRGQRPRPCLREGRPVHARRRGGVPAARRTNARPRPAHRDDARRRVGPRARGAHQPRAHAIGDRDHDSGVSDGCGREPGAGQAPRVRDGDRERQGPEGRISRNAPVQPLRAPADHGEGPVSRADRPDAVHRPPRAHLRDARARRGRRSREGDQGRQRAPSPARPAARALRELALLARRAHRSRVEPADGLLVLPPLGTAASLSRLRGLRGGRRPARAVGLHRRTTRASGGTSGSTRASARSRSGSATP